MITIQNEGQLEAFMQDAPQPFYFLTAEHRAFVLTNDEYGAWHALRFREEDETNEPFVGVVEPIDALPFPYVITEVTFA